MNTIFCALVMLLVAEWTGPGDTIAHEEANGSDRMLESRADFLASNDQYDEAIQIYLQLLEKEYNPGISKSTILYKTGNALVLSGREAEALPYLKTAYNSTSLLGESNLQAKIFTALGRALEYIGHPDSAFNYYERATKIWEQSKDTTQIAAAYQNMAQILRVINRLDKARMYCQKALKIIDYTKDHKIAARIYNESAYLYELGRQLDSAKLYYQKLIDASLTFNNLKGLSAGYSNLASVLMVEKKFSEALTFYNMGLEIDKQLNDNYFLACSYRGISDCYCGMGDYSKAAEYMELSDRHCSADWLNEILINEQKKYELFKASGHFQNALEAFERFKLLQDSLLNIENQKNISEILAKYEAEIKERQIESLTKSNQIHNQRIKIQTLILALLILVLLSMGLIINVVVQTKNKRISQMKRALQSYTTERLPHKASYIRAGNEEQAPHSLMALGLTRREAEILDLIRSGLTNEQISERLFVSKNTIKFHIKNIYIKLAVKNRAQALKTTSY